MVQSSKIIGGIVAIIIGFLIVQITHIILILTGSLEGMLYVAAFDAEGSLQVMILLGVAGMVAAVIGIILIGRGIFSQDTYYYPDEDDFRENYRHTDRRTSPDNWDEETNAKSFCPYCGAKLSSGTKFCTACGKRLS